MDQALLIFHEALYLIGRETNHFNSDKIRELNSILFSEELNEDFSSEQYFSQNAKQFQLFLTYYFGDYIRFFIQEDFYTNPLAYAEIFHKNN